MALQTCVKPVAREAGQSHMAAMLAGMKVFTRRRGAAERNVGATGKSPAADKPE